MPPATLPKIVSRSAAKTFELCPFFLRSFFAADCVLFCPLSVTSVGTGSTFGAGAGV